MRKFLMVAVALLAFAGSADACHRNRGSGRNCGKASAVAYAYSAPVTTSASVVYSSGGTGGVIWGGTPCTGGACKIK